MGSFGWIEIMTVLFLWLILFVTALVLMAKKEKSGLRFLVWVLVLFFFPFLGSIAYIIYYYLDKKPKTRITTE
jgi:hypothetical protein